MWGPGALSLLLASDKCHSPESERVTHSSLGILTQRLWPIPVATSRHRGAVWEVPPFTTRYSPSLYASLMARISSLLRVVRISMRVFSSVPAP